MPTVLAMEVHDEIELVVAIQIARPDNVIVRLIDKAVGQNRAPVDDRLL